MQRKDGVVMSRKRLLAKDITVPQDLLEKNEQTYNSYYHLYRAEYCKATGLPMFSGKTAFTDCVREGFYTRTRAKVLKIQIDDTRPVGWYRMKNGYAPLFKEKF